MDRNFRLFTGGFPLPLYASHKRLLMEALQSDLRFLEEQGLVDYSLLMGLPEPIPAETKPSRANADTSRDGIRKRASVSGNELSSDRDSGAVVKVGVIDFLQVYNLKKMVESNVKRAGMIAGQLEPTVIDPVKYRCVHP